MMLKTIADRGRALLREDERRGNQHAQGDERDDQNSDAQALGEPHPLPGGRGGSRLPERSLARPIILESPSNTAPLSDGERRGRNIALHMRACVQLHRAGTAVMFRVTSPLTTTPIRS